MAYQAYVLMGKKNLFYVGMTGEFFEARFSNNMQSFRSENYGEIKQSSLSIFVKKF